jgi:hypothetical protein
LLKYSRIINGEEKLPQSDNFNCSIFFKEKGYTCVRPFQRNNIYVEDIVSFFNEGPSMLTVEKDDCEDVYTVFELDEEQKKIVFAAQFFVAEVGRVLLGYICTIKTAEEHKRKKKAAKFVDAFSEFLGKELKIAYKGAYIVAGIFKNSNAADHFFKNRGFTAPLPRLLQELKQKNCTMTSLCISKIFARIFN